MEKRTAIYIRTSTDLQTSGLEAQLMSCQDYCKREGITDPLVFSDDGISGKDDSRPALDALRAAIANGEIDRVLVYCLSRLSRNIIQCHLMVEEFRQEGVTLVSCTETLDTESPEGRLLYAILAAFSQFQREDIVRKVKNGLENARRKGVKLGRKQTREDAPILALLAKGQSPTEIAKRLKIPRSTVYRAKAGQEKRPK